MATLNASDVLTQLAWRYAVKKFDAARKISPSDWQALEQSLVLSPSSFGLQPWKFLVVQDPALRERLLPASWNQRQVIDASHLVVLLKRDGMNTADVDRLIHATATTRQVPVESLEGYRNMMVGFIQSPTLDLNAWAERQVYIALGTFMTVAAAMGIDTCPMEGIVPAQYNEILNLSGSGYSTSVVAVAGYRATDDKYASLAKIRYPTSDVVEYR
jgi:nitroreductase